MFDRLRQRLLRHINLGTIAFSLIVVYLLAYVVSYIGKDKLAIYEVSQSNIIDHIEGTGVILREESLMKNEKDGYINYCVRDGSRVENGGTVYTVDITGKIQTYLEEMIREKGEISEDEKNRIDETLSDFSVSYEDRDFSRAFEVHQDIRQELVSYTDTLLTEHWDEMEKICGKNSYVEVRTPQEGLVSFSSDSLEGLTADKVSADVFASKAKMKDLRSVQTVKKGTPVCRLVTSQNWQLYVPVGKQSYEHLMNLKEEGTTTLQVTFDKDNFMTRASFDGMATDREYYVVLSFNNYVQRYMNQRYLYVELLLSKTNGLKIPTSAIVKKEVFRIPKEFLTQGGNQSDNSQIALQKIRKGRKSVTLQDVTVYKTDQKYAYIAGNGLKPGQVITDTAMENTTDLKTTVSLEGVYIVNRGYTVFRQVDVMEKNKDYCIVSADTSKIELYDRIILNSDTVKENQVIY